VVGIQGKTWHRKHSLWDTPSDAFELRLEAATTLRQPFIPKRRKMHADDMIFTSAAQYVHFLAE
jgi:hypothetical protein